MKRLLSIVLMMVLILLKNPFSYAVLKESEESKIRVNLVVSAEELIRDQIRNYITREFKKFEDIVVVDSGEGDWKLDVIGTRRTARGGYQDYAFSVVILQLAKKERCTFEGHELITGSPSVPDGSRSVANLFLKKYLHKEAKEKMKRYNY